MGSRRSRIEAWLASSSLAAMMIAGGTPHAVAASCTNLITSGVTNNAAVTNYCVQNTSFTGDIINNGTISPNGIAFVGGTITGVIQSTGFINGGISLDAPSQITATTATAAVAITGGNFSGGISNAGTISAAGASAAGIFINNVTVFAGGISNSGTINGTGAGILIGSFSGATAGFSNFSGGISNSGTINSSGFGIVVASGSTFTGGISNSGTINAGFGIFIGSSTPGSFGLTTFSGGITNSNVINASIGVIVAGVSTFTGGIVNSGTITNGVVGIAVGFAGLGVDVFSGGINNSGQISASGAGIVVTDVSTFQDGIVNSGTISGGAATGIVVARVSIFSGGIINSSSGQISATSAGILIQDVSTFLGGITNSGTIDGGIVTARTGISVNAVNLFSGDVVNASTGLITAGVGINICNCVSLFSGNIVNAGTINATSAGISVSVATFSGNVINTGTINAGGGGTGAGIIVAEASTFSGSVMNSGTINAGAIGIKVGSTFGGTYLVETFSGNVANSGTINAPIGVAINGVSTFSGGVVNSAGGIISGATGILVRDVSAFSGNVVNAGAITATAAAIKVGFRTSSGANTVATFSGNIVNSGTLSATGPASAGISVDGVSTFTGGITNGGAITVDGILTAGIAVKNTETFAGNIVNAAGGTITATGLAANGIQIFDTTTTFLGSITNAGTINASAGGGIVVSTGVPQFGSASGGGGIVNSGTINAALGVGVAADTFFGGIFNSGTIAAAVQAGVIVASSTFFGGIGNTGTIASSGSVAAVNINGTQTFNGGIINSGLISASGFAHAIEIFNVTQFTGGIVNTGSGRIISSSRTAIEICNCVSTFAGGIINAGTIGGASGGVVLQGLSVFGDVALGGGITNSGLITVTGGRGIDVFGVSTFIGNISNSGTIDAPTGIRITGGSTFSGQIVNTGTINSSTAIDLTAASMAVTINQMAGTVTGDINLSPNGDTLNVSGGTIAGNILGPSPAAPLPTTINFALGSGTFTYGNAFNFTAIDQVNVNSGTVILNGAGNAATATTVNGGTLQIGDADPANAGATYQSAVTVLGGTLSGHGTVNGDVDVEAGGTLMPGGSIGTLTITGNLTINNGSYLIELSPTANSTTNVSGAAELNGTTVLLKPTMLGAYAARGPFSILTAGSLAANPDPPALGFAGSVRLNGVTLSTTGTDLLVSYGDTTGTLITPFNASINQQNVVNGINNFIFGGGTPGAGFQTLAGLTGNALLQALDQLSGEPGASFIQSGFNAGNQFLNTMLNPNIPGRNGGGGGAGPMPYAGGDNRLHAPNFRDAFASIMPAERATFASRFSAWGSVYGASGSIDGNTTTGSHDTSSRVYGFAGGLDYAVRSDLTIGFALAGGGTHWNVAQGLGSGRSDMFQAGAYGSYRLGAAYVAAALAYAWHDVTTTRTLNVSGTDTLQGHFNVNGLSARIESGYRLAMGSTGVTPYGAVQTQWMRLPSYAETATTGSNQFALGYASQNPVTVRTEIGAWFDHRVLLAPGSEMTFYSRLAWAHDFNNKGNATAFFQSLPGSNFVVSAAKPAADGALVTAGATHSLANGWSFTAKFDGEFSGTTAIYAGTGAIRRTW